MTEILKNQLDRLRDFKHSVDGVDTAEFPDNFSEIVFYADKSGRSNTPKIKVVFESYVVNPFDGFDLHDKFNNGQPPYDRVMYGEIVKETPKMYLLRVFTETTGKEWTGWCYKKCCQIFTL